MGHDAIRDLVGRRIAEQRGGFRDVRLGVEDVAGAEIGERRLLAVMDLVPRQPLAQQVQKLEQGGAPAGRDIVDLTLRLVPGKQSVN